MVRVPSNSNLTPGGTKEFPAEVACGRLDLGRPGQISGVSQGLRRWQTEGGGPITVVRP